MDNKRSFIILEPNVIDLDLPQTEEKCLAIIQQYSKQKQGCYYGSHNYLAFQLNKTRQMVSLALSNLESKNLIEKRASKDSKTGYGYFINEAGVASTLASKGKPTCVDRQIDLPKEASPFAKNGKSTCTDNIYNINNNIKINTSECISANVFAPPTTHTSKNKPMQKLEFVGDENFVEIPTLAEVQAEIEANGYEVDASHFWGYYERSKWVDKNGRQITLWRQKLYQWHIENAKKAQAELSKPRVESDREKQARLVREFQESVEQEELRRRGGGNG